MALLQSTCRTNKMLSVMFSMMLITMLINASLWISTFNAYSWNSNINQQIHPILPISHLNHTLMHNTSKPKQRYNRNYINNTQILLEMHRVNISMHGEYLDIDLSLPPPYIPKQQMISMEELVEAEGPINHKCQFKGKIFVLGVCKTGTTSMKSILRDTLQYKCINHPIRSCGFIPMSSYIKEHWLTLDIATDDISWAFHSKSFHDALMELLKKATVFADAPWCTLYPLFDQLIPDNHSKFILTIRDSTRDVVNSNMKMFVRQYIERMNLNLTQNQFDYTNFTENMKSMPLHARWYELHNKNVINYFTKRGRLNDLLVINLKEEAQKMPYSEQWYKITNFLGCPNVTNQGLPKDNVATQHQIDFLPKDYIINWKNFTLDPGLQRILKFVRDANGTYDYETWNTLRTLYGPKK